MADNIRSQARGGEIQHHWYPEYWAQTWYRNTFLVHHPDQIGRTTCKPIEWNSIFDAGCNFVCLAMVLQIDPARLASMLSRQQFFCADRDLPAKRLSGNSGGLVWDQNAPNHRLQSIVLKDVWHPKLLRRVSITISFIRSRAAMKFEVGARMVAAARARHRHVICGPEAHSHLVAGTLNGDYFVWDPDDTERSVEENLAGEVSLRRLFDENKNEPIEFWEYRVQLT